MAGTCVPWWRAARARPAAPARQPLAPCRRAADHVELDARRRVRALCAHCLRRGLARTSPAYSFRARSERIPGERGAEVPLAAPRPPGPLDGGIPTAARESRRGRLARTPGVHDPSRCGARADPLAPECGPRRL